jgi:hypothetical protein
MQRSIRSVEDALAVPAEDHVGLKRLELPRRPETEDRMHAEALVSRPVVPGSAQDVGTPE